MFHFLDATGLWLVEVGELSLAFLNGEQHGRLHADFMGDPTPTDVITFPGDPRAGLAGEICVSIDAAWEYARSHPDSFENELTLYLIHGYLHLAGFKDGKEEERREMRDQEQICLSALVKNGKIPLFTYERN
ncbi:MAG: rRNA maturation RNase YbeY [Opitutae bacterium]|nr:rRNA maturation RNase YbeY [Opitutae bacterium]